MEPLVLARRALIALAICAFVAGCATPEESGPTDLNRDDDRNGLRDDTERNLTNGTANDTVDDTRMPGGITPEYEI